MGGKKRGNTLKWRPFFQSAKNKRFLFLIFLQMLIFHQLKQELTKSYSKVGREQGLVAIQASMPLLEANIPLLGWLKTQKTSYPHFFLQYRDTIRPLPPLAHFANFIR